MRKIPNNLVRFLLLTGLVLIPLSCTTFSKKESPQEAEKATTVTEEIPGTSLITELKPEALADRSRISIKATGPIQYTAFKLTDPLRLILDISDMRIKQGLQETIPFNKGAVNTISTHYFDESNISRVIIGLDQNVSHDIFKISNNELEINIDIPGDMQAKAASGQELTAGLPVLEKETDEVIISQSTGPVEIQATTGVGPEGDEILLEEQPPDGPEISKEAFESGKQEVKQKKKYTGHLISLDFQNADLTNILRLIASVSNLNIITAQEVTGTVTLRLIEVPWDQALDLILKNNRLGMVKEGNIIRITTLAILEQEKQAEIAAVTTEQASKKSKEATEKLVFKIIPINYATPGDVKTLLDGIKSARGTVEVDARTNSLIINEIQSKIDEMLDYIKRLDTRTRQVVIEARIVTVSTKYSREMGIQWGGNFAATTNRIFPNTIQMRGGLPVPGSIIGGSATGFMVDLPAAAGTGAGTALGLSLGSLSGAALLDIRLSAMESSNNGKVLSSPRITTANHKAASIKSGESIPYQSVSSEGTQTQFVEAVISLTVTPHITSDNFIQLEIKASKNAPGSLSINGVPSISKKEIQTEVLVRDGETTVLGGLYETDTLSSEGGTPYLSKIPILKWLFSQEKKSSQANELLIFITPKIVEDY